MAVGPQGIDVRKSSGQLVFRVLLQTTGGALVTSGTTTLKLYELQDDGDLLSYDFDDDTFKSGALTTEDAPGNMVHQQGNNNSTDTGIWTYDLATLTGFTEGGVYYALANNSNATPTDQVREFQFGGAQGDLTVTTTRLNVNVNAISEGTTEADRLEAALTTANGIDLNMGQSLPAAPGTADTTGEALSQAAVVQKDQWDRLFTGFSSGATKDTLVGHLRAMSSVDAAVPSSGFGTYDKATDSLEALGAGQVAIKGSGFATGTDSLQAIRDYLETLIAPSLVGSSALSGSGFLSDVVSLIRKMTNEPATGPKYTDADIVDLVQAAFDVILADIAVNTDHAIMVRWTLNIVDNKLTYTLPANCSEVWAVRKINTTTQTAQWEMWPGNHFAFEGSGWVIEGNTLRLLRDWDQSETLEILYVPAGETHIHKGTASASTTTTLTLDATPTDGTLDTRVQAYAGYMVRILSDDSSIVQERIISDYVNTTKVATVSEAFSPTLAGTIVYEVLPQYSGLLKHVVALRAAIDLLSQERQTKGMSTLERNLASKMRALRLNSERKQGRFMKHMEGDTPDNYNRGGTYDE